MHYEFLPQGQTVNQNYYNDTSNRLQENEWSERPEKWNSGDFSSNMTMHMLALLCLCVNFCLKRYECHSRPSLFTRFSGMWLLSFPKLRTVLQGGIWHDHDSRQITGHICEVSNDALHRQDCWAHCIKSKKTTPKETTLIGRWVLQQQNNISPETT